MAIRPVGWANVVFPLCKEEEQAYSRCTSNTPQDVVHRYLAYYIQQEEARKDFLLKCGGCGAAAATLVAMCGLKWTLATPSTPVTDNSGTKTQDNDGSQRPPPSMALAGLIGFSIGASIGACWSVRTVAYSTEFAQWKDKAIRSKLFPLFQKVLETSDLSQFVCPITLSLIDVPMQDPTGKWYEKEDIERWINQENGKPVPNLAALPTEADRTQVRFRTSPYKHMNLQIGDLIYDGTYHVKVAKAIRGLFDKQIEQQAKDGLFAYYNTIKMDRATLLKTIEADLCEKKRTGQISQKERDDALQACENRYHIPALENRDQKV